MLSSFSIKKTSTLVSGSAISGNIEHSDGYVESAPAQGEFKGGVIADVDLAEISFTLGTIDDRLGNSTNVEGDLGGVGGEVYLTGRLEGSGFGASLYGPGGGLAVTTSETTVVGEELIFKHD